MSSRSNDPSPDSPSEDEAEAIGKALHFEYVNGLLTLESPVKASAHDMWERLDRDQHRMWDEIDPDRRRSYTVMASRLLARLRAPDSVEPLGYVVVESCSWMKRPTVWGNEDPDSSGADHVMNILPFTQEEAEVFALTLQEPDDMRDGVSVTVEPIGAHRS